MTPRTALDGDRIRIADTVFVYLERTTATPRVLPPGTTPRPYGALPLATAPNQTTAANIAHSKRLPTETDSHRPSAEEIGPGDVVIAPAMPAEAIWLGFQAVNRDSPANIRVRVDTPQPIDAITGEAWHDDNLGETPRNYLRCPPDTSLTGPPGPGGHRLFGNNALDRITLFLLGPNPGKVTIQLLPPAQFARLSGRQLHQLNTNAAFTGRRLP